MTKTSIRLLLALAFVCLWVGLYMLTMQSSGGPGTADDYGSLEVARTVTYPSSEELGKGDKIIDLQVGEDVEVDVSTIVGAAAFQSDLSTTARNAEGLDQLVLAPNNGGQMMPMPRSPDRLALWSWLAKRPGVAIIEFHNAQGAVTGTLRVTVVAKPSTGERH